jgi:peptide/nickel transport system substrate-binding protein
LKHWERLRFWKRRERGPGKSVRALVLGVVGISMLALAGCGASPSGTTSASHPSALNIAMLPQQDVTWWPPLIPANNCGTVTGGPGGGMWTYVPLLSMNGAAQIDWPNSIAQSVTHNANGTVYVVHLNPQWHWSNGQPVTASDVAYWFTLASAASNANAPLFYCYANTGGVPGAYKSVVATNEYTLTITTKQPQNPEWFIYNSIAQFIPMPKAQWDKYSNPTQELNWIKSIANTPTNPVYQVTDGAYLFKAAKTDQYYEFVANPHYSGSQKPHIKTVYYDYETSYSSIFTALKKGAVQYAPYDSSLWADRSQLTGDTILSTPQYGFYYGLTNFEPNAQSVGALFQNLYVRQAMQYGINQPAIIKDFYFGQATPTYAPVPTIASWYDKSLKNPYPFDPAKGTKLLEDHGWKMVNGVMEKNGQKLAFTAILYTGAPVLQKIAEYEQSVWKTEGIDVTLKPISLDQYANIAGANPATANQWAFAFGAEWFYIPDYFPSGDGLVTTNGGYNFDYYNNPNDLDPHMTSLINKLTQPATLAQTQQTFYAYEHYAATNLPMLYFPTPTALTAVSNQLGGMSTYNDLYSETNVQNLYWK